MIKRTGIVALILAMSGSATVSRELTVTDQQQQAIYTICEKAARSPSNTMDELVDIGLFCRSWRELVTRNNAAPPPPTPPAPNQER